MIRREVNSAAVASGLGASHGCTGYTEVEGNTGLQPTVHPSYSGTRPQRYSDLFKRYKVEQRPSLGSATLRHGPALSARLGWLDAHHAAVRCARIYNCEHIHAGAQDHIQDSDVARMPRGLQPILARSSDWPHGIHWMGGGRPGRGVRPLVACLPLTWRETVHPQQQR